MGSARRKTRRTLAFHFGLVQDVTILRPLVRLAAKISSDRILLLVGPSFAPLDPEDVWWHELEALAAATKSAPQRYDAPADAVRLLGAGTGMIIAGSESTVGQHWAAHALFRSAPAGFVTVALQHGLECVGFLHNRLHDETSGRAIRFAADIAVGWFDRSKLRSVALSESSKLYIAGPPMLIDPPRRAAAGCVKGLMCENLHSVRFTDAAMRSRFLDAMDEHARRIALLDWPLAIRPHPAGRFIDREGVEIAANIEIDRAPSYVAAIERYAYAVSAPSTILLDCILAGVPAAVWADVGGGIDLSNFAGLPLVSSANDLWRFAHRARWERAELLAMQETYVGGLAIPADVRDRYATLMMFDP